MKHCRWELSKIKHVLPSTPSLSNFASLVICVVEFVCLCAYARLESGGAGGSALLFRHELCSTSKRQHKGECRTFIACPIALFAQAMLSFFPLENLVFRSEVRRKFRWDGLCVLFRQSLDQFRQIKLCISGNIFTGASTYSLVRSTFSSAIYVISYIRQLCNSVR